MFLDPKVKAIAGRVRKWTEAVAKGNHGEHTLCGYCAISAAEMFRQLSKSGFKPKIHAWRENSGMSHVYVVLDDHVVDVTATQFDELARVKSFIAHQKEAERWKWYQSGFIFNDVQELINWQERSGWPSYQTARLK